MQIKDKRVMLKHHPLNIITLRRSTLTFLPKTTKIQDLDPPTPRNRVVSLPVFYCFTI